MTLVPPSEGFQYEEGVFSSDFEPMYAFILVFQVARTCMWCFCILLTCWTFWWQMGQGKRKINYRCT